MGKTWFEDMDGYLKNLPINAISKVTLLLAFTVENFPQLARTQCH
jgi:hypothetical protein